MNTLYLGNPSKVCKFFNIVMKGWCLSYCGEWGAKPCFEMLCHGLKRWFHISEKHVIPILWQPDAATWEKVAAQQQQQQKSPELVHCGYCKASSLLHVLWGYLGRPIGCFHWLMLGNPICMVGWVHRREDGVQPRQALEARGTETCKVPKGSQQNITLVWNGSNLITRGDNHCTPDGNA